MVSSVCRVVVVLSVAGGCAVPSLLGQQPSPSGQQPPSSGQQAGGQQQPGGRGARRVSPPQPQQKQDIEYFLGAWAFSWVGRESPVTPGPRSGRVTFQRTSSSDRLDVRVEGRIEEGPAFTESGTFEWDGATKTVAITERLSGGGALHGVGDWASPLSIRYESQPLTIGTQTVKVRRRYAILSASSFTVAEEISIDNGPYQRLGNGSFTRSAP